MSSLRCTVAKVAAGIYCDVRPTGISCTVARVAAGISCSVRIL